MIYHRPCDIPLFTPIVESDRSVHLAEEYFSWLSYEGTTYQVCDATYLLSKTEQQQRPHWITIVCIVISLATVIIPIIMFAAKLLYRLTLSRKPSAPVDAISSSKSCENAFAEVITDTPLLSAIDRKKIDNLQLITPYDVATSGEMTLSNFSRECARLSQVPGLLYRLEHLRPLKDFLSQLSCKRDFISVLERLSTTPFARNRSCFLTLLRRIGVVLPEMEEKFQSTWFLSTGEPYFIFNRHAIRTIADWENLHSTEVLSIGAFLAEIPAIVTTTGKRTFIVKYPTSPHHTAVMIEGTADKLQIHVCDSLSLSTPNTRRLIRLIFTNCESSPMRNRRLYFYANRYSRQSDYESCVVFAINDIKHFLETPDYFQELGSTQITPTFHAVTKLPSKMMSYAQRLPISSMASLHLPSTTDMHIDPHKKLMDHFSYIQCHKKIRSLANVQMTGYMCKLMILALRGCRQALRRADGYARG